MSRLLPVAGRVGFAVAGLVWLAGCAASPRAHYLSTNYYLAHAPGDYRPPGPPSDPWGPYIALAASRFDVPEQWIRQVMRVESGGQEYMNGQLTVSPAGAMGLMQLEPETYQEMASRYGLGGDPFNPYDNIMAGTAYIHEMYQVYGSPGFLAAYNAGPGRLDDYMSYHTPLPNETVNYVANIAPNIQGYYPHDRSEADQLALNTLPMSEAPGLVPPGFDPGAPPPTGPLPGNPLSPEAPVAVASLSSSSGSEIEPESPQPVSAQPLPVPPVPAAAPVAVAMAAPLPPPAPVQAPAPPSYAQHPAFGLIQPAMADTPARSFESVSYSSASWGIQVGAYGSAEKARAAIGIAELTAVQILMNGHPVVVAVHDGAGTIYRARVVQFTHEQAMEACRRLEAGPTGCEILSPDAQS